MSLPDQAKHIGDMAAVPAGATAFLNLLNPVLDTILAAATIVWVLYRIYIAYSDRRDRQQED